MLIYLLFRHRVKIFFSTVLPFTFLLDYARLFLFVFVFLPSVWRIGVMRAPRGGGDDDDCGVVVGRGSSECGFSFMCRFSVGSASLNAVAPSSGRRGKLL